MKTFRRYFDSFNVCVVGNKKDLASERKVSNEIAYQTFVEEEDIFYIETSCVSNENVEDLFLLPIYNQFILSNSCCETSYLPSFIMKEWNQNVHSEFPKIFRNSIFTFLVCAKQKIKIKIPKFIIFEIIKMSLPTLSSILQIHQRLDGGSQEKWFVEKPKTKKSKKGCLIS